MEYQTEATNRLRQTGFNELEINRLKQLRRQRAGRIDWQDDVDTIRHLQFLRWLVATGRLTEQRTEGQLQESGKAVIRNTESMFLVWE